LAQPKSIAIRRIEEQNIRGRLIEVSNIYGYGNRIGGATGNWIVTGIGRLNTLIDCE